MANKLILTRFKELHESLLLSSFSGDTYSSLR